MKLPPATLHLTPVMNQEELIEQRQLLLGKKSKVEKKSADLFNRIMTAKRKARQERRWVPPEDLDEWNKKLNSYKQEKQEIQNEISAINARIKVSRTDNLGNAFIEAARAYLPPEDFHRILMVAMHGSYQEKDSANEHTR